MEYAFVLLVLVALVIASIEFGTIMLTSILMESRLRETARFGIIEARALGLIHRKQEAWRALPHIRNDGDNTVTHKWHAG